MRNIYTFTTTHLESLLKSYPNHPGARGAKKELKRRLKEEIEDFKLSPGEEEQRFLNYIIEHKRVSAEESNDYMKWNIREGTDKRTLYKKRNPHKIDYDKASNCYVSLDVEATPDITIPEWYPDLIRSIKL